MGSKNEQNGHEIMIFKNFPQMPNFIYLFQKAYEPNMRLKDSKQCMVDDRYIPKHFQKLAKGYCNVLSA